MAYATIADIEDRLPNGLDDLKVLAGTVPAPEPDPPADPPDPPADPVLNEDVVNGALADGADEIDTYVGAVYDLPLASVPAVLTRLNVDISIYRMARDAGRATDENRLRYEDAVKLLDRISKGTAKLNTPEGEEPPAQPGASFTAQPRRFQRGRMP